ncbi:unnamed protein product [Eruca vesicaria subsp. sativa]|uniref:Uncharacterized protein n=1 Tax=Eruca vesicaria subsp. sativa TaxID=29727 RepID=A0ABC8JN78_ERUVS|nr:unnamed protein product [Eruca vesicaria subsp. sativa]
MSVCGGPSSPLMKCITPNEPNTSPVRTDVRSKYSSYLKYYTSACQLDPDLKNFDSSHYERIASVINTLADQAAKSQSISQGSLMDAYECLLDLNRDVVMKIIDSKEDVRKNKDLRSLVHLYFKNSSKTLDLCNTIENCVKRAENSQRIIRQAVNQFEDESVGAESKKNKYAKTLEELNKFKAMGDPFDGEFLTQYESVYEEKVLLLNKLSKLRAKLDKKERNVKIWRRLSNIVFISAFASLLLLSVLAAALTAPLVLTAVVAGLSRPIEIVGEWCNEMWKNYEKGVKSQRASVSTVENDTKDDKIATETIREEVEKVRKRISDILESVEFAVEREEDELATRLAMQAIKKKIDGLTDEIKEVGQHAAMFRDGVALGRLVVLTHFFSLPNSRNGIFHKITSGISKFWSRLFTKP